MKLVHLLIGKSILETLLVGVLAVGFMVNAFPPSFRGWGEVADNGISGWATNADVKTEQVQVQLFVDGNFIAHGLADRYRPDVRAAGWASDDWHGYHFPLTGFAKGKHQARIYALHASGAGRRQTLQLLGDAIDFSVDDDGRISPLGNKTESSK